VFQVMFSYAEGAPGAPPARGEGPVFRPLHADVGAVAFDLGLAASAHEDGVSGVWSYSADLFEPATAARMARGYEALLARAAADPEVRLSALAALPDADRARVLGEWNATGLPLRSDVPVGRLFEEQADRTPEAPAIVFEGEALTYRELDRRASRLARRLRAIGVGPETRVAVCLERSPELPVAVLAALKAGGAYVPLDPAYPAARLARLLRDSAATVLVAAGSAADALPTAGVEVVRPDAETGEGDGRLEDAPPPEAAAYVVYTSGSTGEPKGVVVEHRSLAGLLLGAREAFGFGPGDVVPSLASSAFDIWGFEVLAPLLAGGTVRLLPAERITEPGELVRDLADATVLHAVPALMRSIVDAAGDAGLPRLRRVFTGGDRVPPGLLRELREAFPAAEAWVLYGPTEATVLATRFRVPPEGEVGRHPIGTPLPNARAYVCGPALDPVAPGVPGELCIGGAGVARGYLGRPDLTAERWVPDPFSGEAGARLYRTGDLARWRPDGALDFLGRADAQVKVRGFRVEPGEVEAAILRAGGLREAVVVAREDAPGDVRLVAYLVPEEGTGGSVRELRAALAAELPEHMVPTAFVVLERIPRTPNGKLDARALPAPALTPSAEEHVEPRTALERVLAGIWAEVLGVERVGARDRFFDLGGHSLLATQVAARAGALRIAFPVRWIFQHPTVEALARAVTEAEARPGQAETVAAAVLRIRNLDPEARRRLLAGRATAEVES
ncbi:MAG TPA: amino acid adenylation domain-containing protein, partial [Longimicrobiaceae bacterium]